MPARVAMDHTRCASPRASTFRRRLGVDKSEIRYVADEVYQDNVYREGKKFTSFKKIVRDLWIGVRRLPAHFHAHEHLAEVTERKKWQKRW